MRRTGPYGFRQESTHPEPGRALSCGRDAAKLLCQGVDEPHQRTSPRMFIRDRPIEAWGKALHDPDRTARTPGQGREGHRVLPFQIRPYGTRRRGTESLAGVTTGPGTTLPGSGKPPVRKVTAPPLGSADAPNPSLPSPRWKRLKAAGLLVLLSIIFAEFFTGSTSVWSLADPINDLGLLGFYGAGVLLIREVARRWGNGWGSILLLGLAYGIAEEGIALKTMVDPARSAVPLVGPFSRILGINTVWAVSLDLFHAVYSIGLPILLVDLTEPQTRQRDFLGTTGMVVALIVLSVSTLVGYLRYDPGYFEGYPTLALLLITMGLCVVLARGMPGSLLYPRTTGATGKPWRFFALGAGIAAGWGAVYTVGSHLFPFPLALVGGELLFGGLALSLVVRWMGQVNNGAQKSFLALGLLAWALPWGLVLVFVGGDYPLLLFLVGTFALLVHLARRYLRDPR